MNINAGTILLSTPSLSDDYFGKSIVFITEHNNKGAIGFMLNKIYPRVFNELIEFKNSTPLILFEGGPVEQEKLFVLHRRPDLIEGSEAIAGSIYMGGDFKQAVEHINNKTIQQSDIKLFIGYCGWNSDELEEEIKEGSWIISPSNMETVFSDHVEKLWEKLYVSK
jgi:putative transcriptional regulator